jgi:hypothetical protein
MRPHFGMPKPAGFLSFLSAVLLGPLTVGCGPGADSPEVIKEKQQRAAAIREAEEPDAKTAKTSRGKQSAIGKSIKGRLGGAPE